MTMALVFDSLSFAKDLEKGGVPRKQAEAHASAARDYIMKDLVTKQELQHALDTQTLRIAGIFVTVMGAFVVIDKLFS